MSNKQTNLDEMNNNIYLAARHLFEAGIQLRGIYPDAAVAIFNNALGLLDIIDPSTLPKDIVSPEDMEKILSDIFNAEVD